MKKTITLAALALGLAASASAAYTLTSPAVSYTTETGLKQGFAGKYYTPSVTFTLTDDWFNGTATTSNVKTVQDGDSSVTSYGEVTKVGLTSIQFAGRSDSPASVVATMKIWAGDILVATSDSYTYAAGRQEDVFDSNYYYSTRKVHTFTFAALEDVLDIGTAYTMKFYNADGTEVNLGVSVSSTAASGYTSFATNNSSYQPGGVIMQYTAVTAVVPEPATATLSLLALAGLAARRRRK